MEKDVAFIQSCIRYLLQTSVLRGLRFETEDGGEISLRNIT
jgi:hypothetical protein